MAAKAGLDLSYEERLNLYAKNHPIEETLLPASEREVSVESPEESGWEKAWRYIKTSVRQAILGDYAGESTAAGLAGQIGVSFIPVADTAADIRDLSYSVKELWNDPSWSNVGWTALDLIGFIPLIGNVRYLKYGDEAADVVQGVARHADDVIEAAGDVGRHADDVIEAAGDVGRHADDMGAYYEQIRNMTSQRIEHIIHGSKGSDHKWRELVPDENWNDIALIISRVMDEGTEGSYKSVLSKILEIDGKTVEVTFTKLSDGTVRISDAWVK